MKSLRRKRPRERRRRRSTKQLATAKRNQRTALRQRHPRPCRSPKRNRSRRSGYLMSRLALLMASRSPPPSKRSPIKEEMTMALTVTKMSRVFQFQGIRLPDPNPEMSVEEVKALYAAQYPELATAVVNGPEAAGDKMRYT